MPTRIAKTQAARDQTPAPRRHQAADPTARSRVQKKCPRTQNKNARASSLSVESSGEESDHGRDDSDDDDVIEVASASIWAGCTPRITPNSNADNAAQRPSEPAKRPVPTRSALNNSEAGPSGGDQSTKKRKRQPRDRLSVDPDVGVVANKKARHDAPERPITQRPAREQSQSIIESIEQPAPSLRRGYLADRISSSKRFNRNPRPQPRMRLADIKDPGLKSKVGKLLIAHQKPVQQLYDLLVAYGGDYQAAHRELEETYGGQGQEAARPSVHRASISTQIKSEEVKEESEETRQEPVSDATHTRVGQRAEPNSPAFPRERQPTPFVKTEAQQRTLAMLEEYEFESDDERYPYYRTAGNRYVSPVKPSKDKAAAKGTKPKGNSRAKKATTKAAKNPKADTSSKVKKTRATKKP